MSDAESEFPEHDGVALSWSGFELLRIKPNGQVTIADFALRTAQQMITSEHPEERVIGHMARLIVAGNSALQAGGVRGRG